MNNFQNTTAGKLAVRSKPMRQILTETRLSPEPQRETLDDVPFPVKTEASPARKTENVCVNCKTKLTADNQPLRSVKICRKCISVYSVMGAELNRAAERKSRDARLAKLQGKFRFE